ncbi:hypothetical protein KFE98_05000 [bacterium SCSIO 12741]|nr:hypothetical protein KFE98_05000 [bacterium SCSIO 12741]
MLLTDTDHQVEVATVDENGKPVSLEGLEARVYKVAWRWWWSQEQENFANYLSNSEYNLITKKTFNTLNGTGNFTFQIKYPDWGRYLIRITDPIGGHATGKTVYVDWPGWAGRARSENPGGASMLTFSLDKKKYEVGETVRVTVPTSEGGKLLYSLENGSEVIESKWYPTEKDQTIIELEARSNMAPNAYVHITYLQPHAQTANDLPIRLYGILPVLVEDPATRLEPQIAMADELRPEEEFEIKVSEKDGKDMTYTLAVVDEGLLDLTRFKTPNPHWTFYAREALGVKTWDLYQYVIGAYSGKLNALLALGGDEELKAQDEKAKRFKPVVRFLGPFEYTGGTNEHTLKLPNYVGSVRVMVVAGQDKAYGRAEKAVPVKKPLMVMTTLPRVLGPGEELQLPVNVFAMDEKVKRVKLKVSGNEQFEILNPNHQLQFDQIGDQLIYVQVKVKQSVGKGTLRVEAKSGSETSFEELEVQVRNANSPTFQMTSEIVSSGNGVQLDYEPLGIAGTRGAEIEFSSIPQSIWVIECITC